jgi:hypothetical protein
MSKTNFHLEEIQYGYKNADLMSKQQLKKAKNIFYKCLLEFHVASISGLGGLVLSKKVKIVVP